MKKIQLKGLFKVVFLLALCLGASLVANALGMNDNNHNVQMAAVTPVALPLLNQTAEKEMIKKFRHDNTWLGALKSKQGWVDNDVIKIPKRGAAPTVLINNTVYPIVSNGRNDSHVVLSLNKYETTNTTVTAAELYALPYEKVSDVQEQHREELEDKTAQHALHSIAPNTNSANTPVIVCTGAPDANGRPTMRSKDVSRAKKMLDKLLVPKEGRILVLCPDHVADLLDEDRTFQTQYHNATDGLLAKSYYGFMIYESTYNPTYNNGTKVAFGAVDGPQVASVIMHNKTCFKATGSVTRYARPKELDPENRRHTIGFELYFIGIPIRDEGVGAIIS
ncbi:hypothetical protein [Flavobacterium sasangense]|uniref:hypothetical protein n=1 Tax=Flavobacterium sasangense TaxID=503361 RepID=UPI000479A332|nr:hypothetical protein [Flavobacterium sasangense]